MGNSNVNKIILVGNIGNEPELRFTQKGNPFLILSLATNRDYKNAAGDEVSETHWHKATLWGNRAQACAKYLMKGSRIYLEGELRNSSWTDKNGNTRRTSEVHVNSLKFLGGTKTPGPTPSLLEESAPLLTH